MKPTEKLYFREWMPDVPALDNPGWVDVQYALPVNGTYISGPISALTTTALPGKFYGSTQYGPYIAEGVSTANTNAVIRIGTGSTASATITSFAGFVDFYNWDINSGTYFASGQTLGYLSVGSLSYTDVTGAPQCTFVDRINHFMMVGGSSGLPFSVQWSSLDDPNDWPTPLSSTAVARQSGSQDFAKEFGNIADIIGGDEYGIVLQARAVNRVQYIGGNIVFQFDQIAENFGTVYPHSGIRAGNKFYFVADSGIFVTDGFNVQNLSYGKFSKFIRDNISSANLASLNSYPVVNAKLDAVRGLIYWTYGAGFLVYNYLESRASYIPNANNGLLFADAIGQTLSAVVSTYYDTQYTGGNEGAVFQTGDFEPNVGGMSRIDGVAPLVNVTSASVSTSVISRNTFSGTSSTSGPVQSTVTTGFSDHRQEGRYHSAKIEISGTFNSMQGVEVRQTATGNK